MSNPVIAAKSLPLQNERVCSVFHIRSFVFMLDLL